MKRFTETGKWGDPWFRRLSVSAKLLWLYMLDYCSCIGHIDLDLEAVKFHTGTAVTEKHLDELGERVTAIGGGKFFIPKFIGFQYGTLSPMCPAHKPVFKAIAEHRLEKVLNQYQYPNANLSNSLKDIE